MVAMHEAKPALIYQPGVSADAWPPIGGGISVCTSPRAPLRRNTKPVDRDAVTGGVSTFALPGSDSNNFEVFWTACRTVSFDIGVNAHSSRLVDHLVSRVIDYDGRLEILKLGLTSEGGLNSFLKFRSMRQLRSLDAFPIVDGTALTRRFIKQECFADQVWISPPARYRKTIFRNSIFAAHSIRQVKQHDLGNHRTTSLWCENAILPRKRIAVKR